METNLSTQCATLELGNDFLSVLLFSIYSLQQLNLPSVWVIELKLDFLRQHYVCVIDAIATCLFSQQFMATGSSY